MVRPRAVAAAVEEKLAPALVGTNHAWWDVNVDANPEAQRRRIEAEIAMTDLLAEPGLLRSIGAARRRADDPVTRRQLDLLHNWVAPHQIDEEHRHRIIELEAAVEAEYATHRGVVGGTALDDNALRRILRTSDDGDERREAWEASKTIGSAVADRVRELARLRNRAAGSLGYRDWFSLAVAVSEMDEERLFATLDETDRLTREPFGRWKADLDARIAARFGTTTSALRPWHYDDPFFQEVPAGLTTVDLDGLFAGRDVVALAAATYDALELETGPILARSDLFPREGKCQHAFCIDIDRAGDIRVLTNVVADRYWSETMLHELGHAVHSQGYDTALPWLLRDSHLTITEGVAILMGRLVSDAEWIADVAAIGEAHDLAPGLRTVLAADLLVFTRWVLVMTNFERALYRDPEGDLDTIWWDLVERYQLVNRPDGRQAPDWAAKIHVACAPVYYHTYLYGNLIASQLRATIDREVGGLVGRPAAGRLLGERVFAPGESVRWDRLVASATGEPLSARAYAAEIAAGIHGA
jgi:peptidyl-dipeptidase A